MIFSLGSLSGVWLLRRSVDNGATMTGKATFLLRGDGRFDYMENGRLTLANGQTFDSERRYVFEENSGGFVVWFSETPLRLFHRVVLRRHRDCPIGTAVHLCGEDHYDSRYEFSSEDSFVVRHRVRGPRKGYLMETVYTRNSPV